MVRRANVCRDSFMCVPWLKRMSALSATRCTFRVCDVTPACVCHDSIVTLLFEPYGASFTLVTWLLYICAMTHSCLYSMSHMACFSRVHTCLDTYAVTPSCVCHFSCMSLLYKSNRTSFRCVTLCVTLCVRSLIHACTDVMCKVAHLCLYRDAHTSQLRESRISHVCVMTHSYMCICVPWILHVTAPQVTRNALEIRDVTHWCMCHDSCTSLLGGVHEMSRMCHDSFTWHDSLTCHDSYMSLLCKLREWVLTHTNSCGKALHMSLSAMCPQRALK